MNFNNKIIIQVPKNLELFQCYSQFLAIKTNFNFPLFSPNQPSFILPYNDNTYLSTLSYSDNIGLPLIVTYQCFPFFDALIRGGQ
jgi:hypothetical protein